MDYFYENHVYEWVDLALASALPFMVLLICNIAIIHRLAYFKRKMVTMQSQQSAAGVNLTSLTAMLLACCFTFLITSLPICIYLLGESAWLEHIDTFNDLHAEAELDLAWAVVNLIWYLNFAVNFLVYVLSGPRFRKEVLQMFGLCKHRQNEVGPSTTLNIAKKAVVDVQPANAE